MKVTDINFVVAGKPRVILTNTRFDDFLVEIQDLLNEYVDIIVDDILNEFPPIRSIIDRIYLILGASFLNEVAYRMTPKENGEIKSQVQDLLDKGLVREILCPCVPSTILSLKKDGGWGMCIDSQAINKITITYIFIFPCMDDLMDCLSGAIFFSKIYLKSGYHQIKFREKDEWKTTFKTNDGLYEWLIMPFNLP